MDDIVTLQLRKCRKYGAKYLLANPNDKVGVSRDLLAGQMPLNGLRHPPASGTSGWFLWSGFELSSDPDYFVPLHLHHLSDMKLPLLPFLGLAPGWRFLTDGITEDVWYVKTLLDI